MPSLNTVVRFRQKKRTRFGQPKTQRGKQPVDRRKSSHRKIGSAIAKLVVGALVAAAAFGAYQLSQAGGIEGVAALVSARRQDLLSASFPICGDGPRVTCVVDGDTFWHQGVKIRIADIDTPELTPPRCEAERTKGETAKRRLRELLNAGKFSLVAGWRDEDQHGRKLRTVTRNGRSIGETLIAEGLARRWDGGRRNWCD
ncbi:MAG: thermonuclease family protein [Mesorhizobium sp.]|nr:MAG: thermonuclease family protein [Mesorhizobium sp.]